MDIIKEETLRQRWCLFCLFEIQDGRHRKSILINNSLRIKDIDTVLILYPHLKSDCHLEVHDVRSSQEKDNLLTFLVPVTFLIKSASFRASTVFSSFFLRLLVALSNWV